MPSLDILGNIVPYIGGEEEKLEHEPRKLLGTLEEDRVADAAFVITAQCNRVPVRDGHTECVSIEFERKPIPDEVIVALEEFRGSPEVAELPSTPVRPVVVRREDDRPQPVRDRDAERGMAIVVGRVRPCPLFGIKFVLLGHNTLRGAAGGSIHNAELLVAQGWIARS
jgi:aspartate-semialdehyde dehydrogenase